MPVHFAPFRWWFLLPVLIAFGWVSAVGYQGLNGQDAHDYLHLAQGWDGWVSGGERPIMVEHPHGYPILGALLGKLVGILSAMRALPVLAWIGILWLMHRLLRRKLSDEQLAVYLLLAVSLAPFLLRQAMTVMSDVPALFLIMAAFTAFIRWRAIGGAQQLGWMALALMSALTIRTATAPLVITMVLMVASGMMVHRFGPRTGRGLTALVVVLGMALWWFLHGQGELHDGPLADWTAVNWFRRELHSDDGVLRYTLPNLLYAALTGIHPGQFPIGLLLVPFFRKAHINDPLVRPALIVLAVYLLFVAGLPFQNDRVLLMTQPFVVIAFHRAFADAWTWLQEHRSATRAIVLGISVVQVALFVRAMLPFMRQAAVERELAATTCGFGPARVYTHGMGAALVTYCPDVPVTELWYAELDRFEPGSFIVVRPGDLSTQWVGRPPATNWDALQRAGAFPVVVRPDGWVIARLPRDLLLPEPQP
ncbi:MAG: hypothetical protein R2811_01275 [Flavobacteriales bacterium]